MGWYKAYEGEVNTATFMLKVKVEGKNICLIGYDGKVYAVGADCPHAGADLSDGWCQEGRLICPYHRYSYDIKTGKGKMGQNDFIDSYPVEVREDGIYIGILSFTEKIKLMFR